MNTVRTVRFEVQAYLAVNPTSPKWCRVALTAINGWWKWVDHPNRVRSGFSGAHTYGESFAFGTLEHAEEAMRFFSSLPQQYDLRVVKTVYEITESAMLGPYVPSERKTPPRHSRDFGWPRPEKVKAKAEEGISGDEFDSKLMW